MRLRWLLIIVMLALPWRVEAGINLPYSTSALTCSDFTQTNNYEGSTGCDGVNAYGSWQCDPSHGMQINSSANYPSGAGGKGYRAWYGDSNNQNAAMPEFILNSPQQELWIRYYARWQPGFTGSNLYQKMIYVFQNSGGGTPSITVMALSGDSCELETYGAAQEVDVWYQGCGNTALGFDSSTHLASGAWQLIEYHIKLNTSGQSNGVVEMWINGTQKFSKTNINFGWTSIGRILLPSNNKILSNGACAYYDEDDIAFSATGRIGAIGPGGGTQLKDPQPPIIQGVTP